MSVQLAQFSNFTVLHSPNTSPPDVLQLPPEMLKNTSSELRGEARLQHHAPAAGSLPDRLAEAAP